MWLAEIWRFPVKSMGGEELAHAELTADGIVGDRIIHVENRRGRVVTSRSKPRLLTLRGKLGLDGDPYVDGRHWSSNEVARKVEAAAGAGAHLVRYEGPERFDVLPLLVLTDGAKQAFGYDARRLRPNLIIGGVPGLAERTWEGRKLRIGDCVIAIVDLRMRCIMTTFDPDTAAEDVDVLHKIHREFGGRLALNCAVLEPGPIKIGDSVELLGAGVTAP